MQALEQIVLGSVVSRRFRLAALIGEGSFSRVYVAYDEKNNRLPYAVKILKTDEHDNIGRFQREVQLTQQLEHPHIVRIYSSGVTDSGNPYFVTEYFPDGDLQHELDLAQGKPLPLLRALNIIRFVARGLQHAHSRNILHRDIKPENVLRTPSRSIKISDFGIGLSMRISPRMTLPHYRLGTPAYMAPEQIEGGDLGPWTDIYALGILSFVLLKGNLPFDSPRVTEVIDQQCNIPTPTLLSKGGGIPCWMEDIVHKASEKEISRRYQSARQMLADIEKYFLEEQMQNSLPEKVFYFIRPNGRACTYFTERGIPRKMLGLYLVCLALIAILTLMLFMRSLVG